MLYLYEFLTFTVKVLWRQFALHSIKMKPALCGTLHRCSTSGERQWLSAEAEGISSKSHWLLLKPQQ